MSVICVTIAFVIPTCDIMKLPVKATVNLELSCENYEDKHETVVNNTPMLLRLLTNVSHKTETDVCVVTAI